MNDSPYFLSWQGIPSSPTVLLTDVFSPKSSPSPTKKTPTEPPGEILVFLSISFIPLANLPVIHRYAPFIPKFQKYTIARDQKFISLKRNMLDNKSLFRRLSQSVVSRDIFTRLFYFDSLKILGPRHYTLNRPISLYKVHWTNITHRLHSAFYSHKRACPSNLNQVISVNF